MNGTESMELSGRIRHGAKWLFTGTVGGRMLQFLFNIALARILVPSDFGMLVTLQIFTGLAGYFSGAGMGQALVQVKDLEEHYYDVVFTIQLIIGVMLFGLFWMIAPEFARFFENDLYVPLLRVSALSFLWRPLATVQNAKLQREMRFREISTARIASQVVAGLFTIFLAARGLGVWSLIFGGLFHGILLIFILFRFSGWQPALRFEAKTGKRLGTYGLKVTANSLLDHFGQHIDNLFVSKILGSSPLGLYNKGYSLSDMPKQIVSKSTYKILFRAFSKEQSNLDLSRYLFYSSIKLILLYTTPIFVGMWWIAEPFVHVLYGEKWMGCVPIIRILMLMGIARCLGNISGSVIEAQNRLGKEFFIFVQSLALLTIGCALFTHKGIEYVAIIVLIRTGYATLRIVFFACKLLHARIGQVARAAAPGLGFSLTMLLGLYLEDRLGLASIRSSHEALYLLIVVASGVILYGAQCVFLPVPSIAPEVAKWKRKIRTLWAMGTANA